MEVRQMKRSMPHTTRAIAIGASAVAVCLAGTAFASAHGSGSGSGNGYGNSNGNGNGYGNSNGNGYGNSNGNGYGHRSPNGSARQAVSSGGERFLRAGQTVRLGRVGHFTFSASCMKDENGQNVATFDVTADTVAGLDGNAPAVAGTMVNIHTNSDALDGKDPGEFDQVGSASDSTLIAKDGQEVDVFYNDGVNWPAVAGSQAHACFAGYTGILG
jgi:hypothetical protein